MALAGSALAQPTTTDPAETGTATPPAPAGSTGTGATDPGAPTGPAVEPTTTATAPVEPDAPPAAAATTKPLAISGYVDTQYAFNVARPATGVNLFFPYSYQHNSISLNAAHLVFNGEVDIDETKKRSLSYVVELDAGTDAVINTSNGTPPMAGNTYKVDVQEAYGTFKQDKVGIRAGKFVTFAGIEVIESPANPTITRGYLYGLAEPFTHTGAELFFQATDKIDIHVGVVNGWDVMADNNRGKTAVVKVGIVPNDSSFVTISAYAGPEVASNWRELFDITGQVKAGKVAFNFQGLFGMEAKASLSGETATWFGATVQPVFTLSDQFTLGARAELMIDNNGARTGGLGAMVDPANTEGKLMLINVSATPGYKLSEHFMLRGEARLDLADQKIYINHDGDDATKTQITLLAQAVASF
jgi:hypothetical protein